VSFLAFASYVLPRGFLSSDRCILRSLLSGVVRSALPSAEVVCGIITEKMPGLRNLTFGKSGTLRDILIVNSKGLDGLAYYCTTRATLATLEVVLRGLVGVNVNTLFRNMHVLQI